MLEVEKIINTSNCELVIKWSDGSFQALSAYKLQSSCSCVRCLEHPGVVAQDVRIVSFQIKGRFGLQVRFSSGCQSGIYTFNQIRSWLKNL
jgi:ATP-binding protein involved in chromosome partitioning